MPTVSRVLDRRSDVAPHTPERVEQLLREHGHQRRGPRADGRAWLIDLVFNDLDSPWAVEVIPRRRGGRPRGRCGDRRVGHPPAPQLGPAVAGEPAGLLAVRTVLRLLNGEHLESAKVELATELVRDSTAPPGSAEHRSAWRRRSLRLPGRERRTTLAVPTAPGSFPPAIMQFLPTAHARQPATTA